MSIEVITRTERDTGQQVVLQLWQLLEVMGEENVQRQIGDDPLGKLREMSWLDEKIVTDRYIYAIQKRTV